MDVLWDDTDILVSNHLEAGSEYARGGFQAISRVIATSGFERVRPLCLTAIEYYWMIGVSSLMDRIIASLPRFIIIFSHNLITFLLKSIPFLGAPLALIVTCLVNAYYCFE